MEPDKLNYQQEAEVERLLTTANFRKLRDQLLEAEDLCREALSISPNNPKVHEMLGDILTTGGKAEGALEEYQAAMKLVPGNVAYETKYAKAVLQVAERERLKNLALDMLENPQRYRGHKHNPTIALICSLIPGLGQLYNGEVIKAAIIFGTFLLFLISASVLRSPYPREMSGTVSLVDLTHPFVLIMAVVALVAWVYGLVDAPISAQRLNASLTKQVGL